MLAVEPLEPARYAEIAAMLARAFDGDPMWQYLAPNPRRRPRQIAWLFEHTAPLMAPLGASFITRGGEGAAFWFPPGRALEMDLVSLFRSGFVLMPLAVGPVFTYRNARVYADTLRRERADITGPHWALDAIGVDPAHQRQGVADALLRHVLVQADRDRLPCHVVTHNQVNVPFYEHYGFRVAGRGEVFAGGPFVCSLRRPAATA